MRRVRGQMSESLLLGAMLAVVGGFLDAYTYLCRGGVFANAQTGNIVLLGLNLAEGDPRRALTYLLPILAFAAGVVVTELIRRRYQAQQNRDLNIHWRQVIVLAEAVLVAGAAFVPQSGNMEVNLLISFVCALQVESFRKVRGSAFASTMCTGNLRSGTEQFVVWVQTGDRQAARRGRNYYAVILFFIGGAVLGGFATKWLAERALLCAAVLLLAVFGVMFIEEERSGG